MITIVMIPIVILCNYIEVLFWFLWSSHPNDCRESFVNHEYLIIATNVLETENYLTMFAHLYGKSPLINTNPLMACLCTSNDNGSLFSADHKVYPCLVVHVQYNLAICRRMCSS